MMCSRLVSFPQRSSLPALGNRTRVRVSTAILKWVEQGSYRDGLHRPGQASANGADECLKTTWFRIPIRRRCFRDLTILVKRHQPAGRPHQTTRFYLPH